jgi:hypothetical protein
MHERTASMRTVTTARALGLEAALLGKSFNSVVPTPIRDAKGEPLPFDFSAGAAILSNGAVLFADRYDPRVILSDSSGRFIAAAGRKGSGPGEFAARSRLLRLRGDSVGVYDGSLRRFSVFDPKLKFVRTELIAELPSAKGLSSIQGQFANGSLVMMHRPIVDFTAAEGTYDIQHKLYTSTRGGTVRQFNLPLSRELQVADGDSRLLINVPVMSIHALAVCEHGFVTIANERVAVYDTSFKLLSTPPYRGRVDTLSSDERTEVVQGFSGGNNNATFDRKIRAAVDAATPRRVMSYSVPVVSADGLLWFQIGKQVEGRFVRTTVRGEIIDTLNAPYQILHANKSISVAYGPFEEDEEAPLVIVRQKVSKAQRKPIPPSPLGRCNSLVTY